MDITPEEFQAMTVDERAKAFDARPFGPLPANHPIVKNGQVCFLCEKPMEEGQIPTLVILDSPENKAAREASKSAFYNAEATPVHWACLTQSDDPEGDYKRHFDIKD